MPRTFHPQNKEQNVPSFHELWQPVENIFIGMPPLKAWGNRPLQMDFEHQLNPSSTNLSQKRLIMSQKRASKSHNSLIRLDIKF